jgi:hypothetical protein
MRHLKPTRPTAAATAREPRNCSLGQTSNLATPKGTSPQDCAIRAELSRADRCRAGGIAAHGHAPILALCRLLLGAGFNPDRPLEVFRGAVLAIKVRSIGEGAALAVKTAGNGSPIFAPAGGAVAPPVAPLARAATTLAEPWAFSHPEADAAVHPGEAAP